MSFGDCDVRIKPPDPWNQLDWQHVLGNLERGEHYWLLRRAPAEDIHVYLFPPEWDGNWAGKGHWRFGIPMPAIQRGRATSVSQFCSSPEELWGHYITYTLTGEL